MELMKELHDEGATICMVTHDPRYSAVADRTVHLFDGQVVDETDPERSAHAEDLVKSGFEG
jgi:putative ABC transport system ATP-binding protein